MTHRALDEVESTFKTFLNAFVDCGKTNFHKIFTIAKSFLSIGLEVKMNTETIPSVKFCESPSDVRELNETLKHFSLSLNRA